MKELSRAMSRFAKMLIMLVSIAGLVSGAAVAQANTGKVESLKVKCKKYRNLPICRNRPSFGVVSGSGGTPDERKEAPMEVTDATYEFSTLFNQRSDVLKNCKNFAKFVGGGLAGIKVGTDKRIAANVVAVATKPGIAVAAAEAVIPIVVIGTAITVGGFAADKFGEPVCETIFNDGITEMTNAKDAVAKCKEQGFPAVTFSVWRYQLKLPGFGRPNASVTCTKPLFDTLAARGPMVIKDDGGTMFLGSSLDAPGKACLKLDEARAKEVGLKNLLDPNGTANIELDMIKKTYTLGWQGKDVRFYASAKGSFTQEPGFSLLRPSDKVTITLQPFKNEFLSGELKFLRTETFRGGTVTLSNIRPGYFVGGGIVDVSGIQWDFGLRTRYQQTNCFVTLTASGSINGIAK
jgi:hypothetical protein